MYTVLRFAPDIYLRIGEIGTISNATSHLYNTPSSNSSGTTTPTEEQTEQPSNPRLYRSATKEELLKEIEDNTTPLATPTPTPPLTPIANNKRNTQSLVTLKEVEHSEDRLTQSETNVTM